MTDGRLFLPFAMIRNIKLHMADLDLPFAIWCLHHIANGRCNLPSVKFDFFEIISTICHVKHFYHEPSAIRHSPLREGIVQSSMARRPLSERAYQRMYYMSRTNPIAFICQHWSLFYPVTKKQMANHFFSWVSPFWFKIPEYKKACRETCNFAVNFPCY